MPRAVIPHAGVEMYKTYQIAQPVDTHFRQASCAEVECANYQNGWITKVPIDSDFERLVRSSGRRWAAVRQEGGEMVFTFAPGTPCFQESQHRVSLERPALFIVKDGDFRGNPTGFQRQHTKPEFWVEDFAEHQERVSKDRE